jgi:hypothetical protein
MLLLRCRCSFLLQQRCRDPAFLQEAHDIDHRIKGPREHALVAAAQTEIPERRAGLPDSPVEQERLHGR